MTAEVETAILRGRPVVALETSLVAHGLPHPTGVETALQSEDAVRQAGSIPATIGLLDGDILIGMDKSELTRLALEAARKVGPRDIGACVAQRAPGGTTVAGTIAIARICGIRYAATGGIGGAHRGWAERLDISADLAELARTPVCLVSCGIKALLDVPTTVELLESLGIPVIGYRTTTLPLFFSRESSIPVPITASSLAEVSEIAHAHWAVGRQSGILVVQAPPASLALPADEVEAAINQALADATAAGISGQAVTPFVLGRLHERSGGKTEAVNQALIVENAALAGAIAAADDTGQQH